MAKLETPIERILRENAEIKANSVETIAKRLFNLQKLKKEIGLVSRNNINEYKTKLTAQKQSNKYIQTKDKINELASLIRHSANVVGC